MMKLNRNILSLGLMISSLLLLIVLQFFWLKGSYEKAFFDFSRETNLLFRSTVFNLRDSIFARNIEPVRGDTGIFTATAPAMDSLKMRFFATDTLIEHVRVRGEAGKTMVYIAASGNGPADANFLKPLAGSMHRLKGRKSFVIRIGPDTLNIDTLSNHYNLALTQSSIDVPFTIRHEKTSPMMKPVHRIMHGDLDAPTEARTLNVYANVVSTDNVPLNPIHEYSASFSGIRSTILKEISPQIAFACFLTFIIAASFIIMYRSLKTQQRLMELKNDFISNVTHELKTPVATVSVALEALKDFNALENRERTKEYLNIAQSELNRLTLMTDKILKASAFENQGVSFATERVNIKKITDEVLTSMKLVFDKKKLTINYISTGADFELQGSEVHLTNVIYNLVDNALKYSAENSAIDIQLRNSETHLELLIRDYGIGIPKAYHKKVFEKFFRVPTGDVHNVKGYGLGLNYVASIIQSHNGTVSLESEPGKGSLFTIVIPRTYA